MLTQTQINDVKHAYHDFASAMEQRELLIKKYGKEGAGIAWLSHKGHGESVMARYLDFVKTVKDIAHDKEGLTEILECLTADDKDAVNWLNETFKDLSEQGLAY